MHELFFCIYTSMKFELNTKYLSSNYREYEDICECFYE